jgi:hypothetical protein
MREKFKGKREDGGDGGKYKEIAEERDRGKKMKTTKTQGSVERTCH